MSRLLLISNSGRPLLDHCIDDMLRFLGPVHCVHYVTAARLDDADMRFRLAADTLEKAGLMAEHLVLDAHWRRTLDQAQAVLVSGGNTYALLQRLRDAGALAALRARIVAGMPYMGTSAGTNIAGPNILATNDWNVVGATAFDAMGLVPWSINPHYRDVDPTSAPGSETRDHRIAEYLRMNENPVLAIEEETAVRVDGSSAEVIGRGRIKIFRRGEAPKWMFPGDRFSI